MFGMMMDQMMMNMRPVTVIRLKTPEHYLRYKHNVYSFIKLVFGSLGIYAKEQMVSLIVRSVSLAWSGEFS